MNDLAVVWGFEWDQVPSGRDEGPPPGRYLFQYSGFDSGVDKNGNKYVIVHCLIINVIDGPAEALNKTHKEFLSLGKKRLPFSKGFYEMIGAGHTLRKDRGPADAVGTTFEADLIHRGDYRNLRKIEAVDSAQQIGQYEADEADEANEVDEAQEVGEETVDEGDEELSADIIMAMSAAELKDLAAEYDVEITSAKTLKKKKELLIEELIGTPAATSASPRQANVGINR